eukprot:TRINITY_DN5857_c0_g1_i1.p1 TRINITY_DN5857_c0_g1~~TRINITY_DN5857_c0_g1_i1.p1  ORF type:complete len:543 (+),score=188.87 TRINITY_DN5857_c0_g1_i1:88-1716(+)
MALRCTRVRQGWIAEAVLRKFMSTEDVQSRPTLNAQQEITPGHHWLEQHYTLSAWEMLYWNGWRYRVTGELLVGKDWRGNMFFMKENPNREGYQERFARFVEGWELPQDYDTDHLWKKWLEYRMNTAPTASQCAKMHRYQEEKYNVKVLALEWRRALDKESPPQERIRRYAEYSDQKWDMRRSRAIYNQMQSQQWLIQRENQPDIQDRFWYSRYRDWWETWNFIKLDLLRPPVKQNLWKIEDDARALRHLDAIENADYKLNPWETTRKERYMLTPSHVAGAEVPRSVTHIKKRFDISKLPAVPLGDLAMRISPENPIYGFADDKEYEKWFAEQRKLLISARSELEQMKRDGYRPAEIGGDLDPYVASRPQDSWKLARKKRIDLLDKARAERTALENRKRDARERLLGSMESQQTLQEQAAFRPFVETAVYTKDFGKIEANRTRRQYIDGTHGRVLRPTASVIDDDDTELVSEPNDAVRTVFGGKGAALFSTSTAMTKDKASRPDAARPDARTLEQAAQEHQEALAKQRQEEEEKAERKKDSL